MKFRYVIDANVLMSILISGKSQYVNLLSLFDFVMPEFAFVELNLYNDVIRQKTKLDENQFRDFTYTVFSMIKFFPTFIQKDKSIQQAVKLCDRVDIKDVSYVSLAIDTELILLTRDVKLYNGLKKQGFKHVTLFEDFLNGI